MSNILGFGEQPDVLISNLGGELVARSRTGLTRCKKNGGWIIRDRHSNEKNKRMIKVIVLNYIWTRVIWKRTLKHQTGRCAPKRWIPQKLKQSISWLSLCIFCLSNIGLDKCTCLDHDVSRWLTFAFVSIFSPHHIWNVPQTKTGDQVDQLSHKKDVGFKLTLWRNDSQLLEQMVRMRSY